MADYKFIQEDDWCGLYIDGFLHQEGHSLDDSVYLTLLLNHHPVEGEDVFWNSDVISRGGRCPETWGEVLELQAWGEVGDIVNDYSSI